MGVATIYYLLSTIFLLAPATQPAKVEDAPPAEVTLQLSDAHPREVLAALARELKMDLKVQNALWKSEEWKPVNINLERASFWKALEEIHAATGLSLQRYGLEPGLTFMRTPVPWAKVPTSTHGRFLIALRLVQGSHKVQLHSPDSITREFSMSLHCFAEPGAGVLRGLPLATITEAVDETGKVLLDRPAVADEVRVGVRRGITNVTGWNWPCKASIAGPPDGGQRLVRLKGSIRVVVQTRAETLEIDDITTVGEVTRTLARRKLTVKSVTSNGNLFHMVQVELVPDPASPDEWEGMNLAGTFRLVDSEGRPFPLRGGTPAAAIPGAPPPATPSGTVLMNLTFNRDDPRGVAGEPLGKPAKLIWELPTETQELMVPFEFRDLPLP